MTSDDRRLPPVRLPQPPSEVGRPFYEAQRVDAPVRALPATGPQPLITRPYDPLTQNPYQPSRESYYQPYSPPIDPERTIWWLLFSFDGRIPRSTYWYTSLAATGIMYALLFLALLPLFFVGGTGGNVALAIMVVALTLFGLLSIPMFWISLAVQVKRWHDLNKPGVWVLINFAPYIGPIWVFIECGCMRGTIGPNQYGRDPL